MHLDPGATYPLAHHRPGILLLDADLMEAVSLDYQHNLDSIADQAGNLSTLVLTIPARTRLPKELQAVVMLDLFPLHHQRLG
jgi:hypothetical protein